MWWFGWAAAAEVRELTLEEAMAMLPEAPELRIAGGRADAADGVARQVAAAWQPVVAVKGSYVHNDHEVVLSFADLFAQLPVPIEAPGDATLQPLEAWTLSGSLQVPLVAPTQWLEASAAHRQAEGADRAVEEQILGMQAGLVSASAGVEAAEGLLAASERALESAIEHQHATEVARAAGTATAVDALTAEAQVARRKGELVTARQGLEDAREALGELLGLEGPARVVFPTEDPAVGEPQRRPLLDAAEAELAAANTRVDAAWSRHLPRIDGYATALASTVPYPTSLKTAWKVGLDATFVLYDGGLRYGRLDQARADRAVAQATLEQRERQVSREVRQADGDLAAAREALELAEQQAALAARAADIARRSYEAGTSSALVARDADTEAFRADVGAVAARARLRTAVAAARRARGEVGGW